MKKLCPGALATVRLSGTRIFSKISSDRRREAWQVDGDERELTIDNVVLVIAVATARKSEIPMVLTSQTMGWLFSWEIDVTERAPK